MKIIIDFLLIYWRELLAVCSVIASLLIWILKKKPVLNEMDNILLTVLEILPNLIYNAELISPDGKVKKELVLESVVALVKKKFSVSLPDSYIEFIASQVELILSTPQKKEILCEKNQEDKKSVL